MRLAVMLHVAGGCLLAATALVATCTFSASPLRAGEADPVLGEIMQGYPLPPDRQVTLQNWLDFPFNRWAFRNMRALFPTGVVAPGPQALPLPAGTPLDVAALHFTDGAGRDTTAAEYFRRDFVDGFIVLHKGAVVYEGYFSSMQPENLHLWQSMTKSVTGLLAEMLIAEGTLDPAKPAGDYIPEIAGTVWGKATLRELLDMVVDVREPSTRAAELPADFWSRVNFLASVRAPGAEQAGPNGGVFYYTNSAPTTVGLVMTKVTGKSWQQLASDMLWSKLGSDHEANIWLDRDGQAAAAGGLSSILRDAARFGQMLARGGLWNSKQVVPPAVIEHLRQDAGNAVLAAQGNVLMLRQRPGMSYRSYWYQVNDGKGSLEALGIYGQHMHINPVDDITIVQLGSFTGPAPDPRNWTALVGAITAALRRAP